MSRLTLMVLILLLATTAGASSYRYSYQGTSLALVQPNIGLPDPRLIGGTQITGYLITSEFLDQRSSYTSNNSHGLITSWLFTDGINTFSSEAGDILDAFTIDARMTGNPFHWDIRLIQNFSAAAPNGPLNMGIQDIPGDYIAEINGSTGSLTSSEAGTWNFAPVPIPAAVCLFGSALGLLGWMRRRTTI